MSQNADYIQGLTDLLPRLRRLARTLSGNAFDADDLVQVALERALARSDQWRPDARLDTWVFGILRNAWLDELRSRTRRLRVFAPEEAGEHVGEPAIERQSDAMSVAAAMARLPDEQREVVALVLVEGLSYRETADLLDLPIGTVTSRLARARSTLQNLLGEPA
ncbi:RNA polymerase sigma factor [Cognatilysobacter bugurensis]|uniref:DNA-directed RNA polymerase sigma-70 factor n=1 Tax=Cognatilysobacter bugurensis TaxID=543356 RepID=A0A918SV29_9GAMM|nr:RNA polymerase sigma factor [Lysobacter bugurensis]GHA69077.1 DNA-directed RNA polymerase sigma-70 factor [Lysobacter bugurensis]